MSSTFEISFKRTLNKTSRLLLRMALCSAMWGIQPWANAQVAMHAYTIQPGDTLIALGERLLRDPDAWGELARINRVTEPRQIPIGTRINIPLYLLKSRTVPATITAMTGQASRTALGHLALPVRVGDLFQLREELRTGSDGYVTVTLADGSVIRIRPSSVVRLERTQHYEAAGFFKTKLNLLQGRIDSLVKHSTVSPPSLEIQTPQTIMGVRGTQFRTIASLNGQATSGAEVLDGTVMAGDSTAVSGGFGVQVNASGTAQVEKLLEAPTWLPTALAVQERLIIRTPVNAVSGAKSYRAQIATDASFDHIVAEMVAPTTDIRFTNIPDGSYAMRVRAVKDQGLEGMDVTAKLVVKARPEPPALMAPSDKAKLRSKGVVFSWTQQTQAHAYHLQIAPAQADWKQATVDQSNLQDLQWSAFLPEGDYQWRVASVRANGDKGPWSDPLSFALRSPPADIPPPRVTQGRMAFQWPGEMGQSFTFEISSEPNFQTIWVSQQLTQPRTEVDVPESGGRLFMRYRAIDADGFVGSFSSTLQVDLPSCLRDSENRCIRSSTGVAITGP